jgi:hypothetical protein
MKWMNNCHSSTLKNSRKLMKFNLGRGVIFALENMKIIPWDEFGVV